MSVTLIFGASPTMAEKRTLMALSVCTVEDEVRAAYGWVSENAPSTSLGV